MSAGSNLSRKNSSRFCRTARGAYLLELLVAMFVSGMMALALTTSLTQGMSSSRGSQNQLLATWLAYQAMDRIRMSAEQETTNTQFFSFKRIFDAPSPSQFQFKLTSNDSTVVPSYDFLQRPLMFDFANYKWNSEDSAESVPKNFKGKVVALIEDRADGRGKNVQITVTWTESTSTGERQFVIKGTFLKTDYET